MRHFEIIDGSRRNALPCAVLSWNDEDTEESTFFININERASIADVPLLFVPFIRQNKRHISNKWTKRWIEERIVPSSRQNLGEVLRANDLKFYDEMALFIAGDGRCEQDDFFVREIKHSNKCANQSVAQQVGRAIKAARNDAGITQYELSKAAKITQSALSNLENGRGNPTINLLNDVANALGKTIDVRII